MSQVLAGCCCVQRDDPCRESCPSLPKRISVAVPSLKVETVPQNWPWPNDRQPYLCPSYCYPDGGAPIILINGQTIDCFLCFTAYPDGSKTWSYRSTPIVVGQVLSAYGYYSPPCAPINLYLKAEVYQECITTRPNGQEGGGWGLTITIDREPGFGLCYGPPLCGIIVNDTSINPCGGFYSGVTNQNPNCQSQSGDPNVFRPYGMAVLFSEVIDPGDLPLGYLTAGHEDYAMGNSGVTCRPTGDYLYYDPTWTTLRKIRVS